MRERGGRSTLRSARKLFTPSPSNYPCSEIERGETLLYPACLSPQWLGETTELSKFSSPSASISSSSCWFACPVFFFFSSSQRNGNRLKPDTLGKKQFFLICSRKLSYDPEYTVGPIHPICEEETIVIPLTPAVDFSPTFRMLRTRTRLAFTKEPTFFE